MTDEASVPAEPTPTPEKEKLVETPAPKLPMEPEAESVPPVSNVEITPSTESPPEIIEPALEPESAPAENDGFTKPVIETEVVKSSSPAPARAESPPTPAPTPQTSSSAPSSPPPFVPPGIGERRAAALEKRSVKKRARLEKIVALARERGKITNNDVQILLGVSHATATRYLVELARTGRITRVGEQKRPFYKPE